MGLGGFIALLISSIHVGSKLLDEKAGNIEYEKNKKSRAEFESYYRRVLIDRDVEDIVKAYLLRTLRWYHTKGFYLLKVSNLKSQLRGVLDNEIDFITKGFDNDNTIMINEIELADLIMSKFGKLTHETVWGWSRLGLLKKVTEDLYDYDISVRVFQCVESNLRNFGYERDILFGIDTHDAKDHNYKVSGKYQATKVVLFGITPGRFQRVYNEVHIPFTSLKLEDLQKAGR